MRVKTGAGDRRRAFLQTERDAYVESAFASLSNGAIARTDPPVAQYFVRA
ncbi:MAG: hypothetical protein ACLUFV_14030 [Acutalibacteraceae bacterium]